MSKHEHMIETVISFWVLREEARRREAAQARMLEAKQAGLACETRRNTETHLPTTAQQKTIAA